MPWRKGNRLHLVNETEASGRVAEIYSEVKAATGLSYVPLAMQAFAAHPVFLALQWQAICPLLQTREFFSLAARLRAEAYTYVHNYFKVPRLGEGLAVTQVAPVTDLLSAVEPAVLLLLSVQCQAFEGPVGTVKNTRAAERRLPDLNPEFIDIEHAPQPVRRTLDEFRHALDLPYSGDDQRALAQWPEFYFAYGQALKPAMQSIFYERAVFRMRESAWNCAQEIPLVVDMEYSSLLETGIDADDIASVTRLTDLLVRGTAAGLLNVTFAKIGLEGGNLAAESQPKASTERVA